MMSTGTLAPNNRDDILLHDFKFCDMVLDIIEDSPVTKFVVDKAHCEEGTP
jgi:hypothetical protein